MGILEERKNMEKDFKKKGRGNRPITLRVPENLFKHIDDKSKLGFESQQKYILRLIELDRANVDLSEYDKPRMSEFAKAVFRDNFLPALDTVKKQVEQLEKIVLNNREKQLSVDMEMNRRLFKLLEVDIMGKIEAIEKVIENQTPKTK